MRPVALFVMLIVTLASTTGSAFATGHVDWSDAPDDWTQARDVPAADIFGHLHAFDEDWYRIEVPLGHILVATTVTGPFWHRLVILSDSGELIADEARSHPTSPPPVVRGGSNEGAVRLGFMGASCCYDQYYHISIQIQPGADLGVGNVVVEDSMGPGAKLVKAAVWNQGPSAATDVKVAAWAKPVDSPASEPRSLGIRHLHLGSGEVTEVRFSWSILGQIGEFEILVEVHSKIESNWPDNAASVVSSVLVDNTGVGFDAPNRHASERIAFARLSGTTGSDARGFYAGTSFGINSPGFGVALSASGDVRYGRGEPLSYRLCPIYCLISS